MAEHGTTAGYSAHKRAEEAPCDACREAERLYTKARREAKKAAAPTVEWPSRPTDRENLINWLAIVPGPAGKPWALEHYTMDPETLDRWLLFGALERLTLTNGVDRILELIEEREIQVLVTMRPDVLFYYGRHPRYEELAKGDKVKLLYADDVDRHDETVGARAVLALVQEDERRHLPAEASGNYLSRHRKQLAGSGEIDALTASWLSEMNVMKIRFAARVLTDRRNDSGVEQRRIQGAVVGRGRFVPEGRFERQFQTREPELKELPTDHPARRLESYISGTSARAPSRR